MSFLVLKAYLKLIQFDLYLARGNFSPLYDKVRKYPVAKTTLPADAVERICSRSTWPVSGTERSALFAALGSGVLPPQEPRDICPNGNRAQQLPFKAHAWVEVDGRVVNDNRTSGNVCSLGSC